MTTFVSGPVEVTVPASSANLGPGYDALGLALGLRDRLTGEVADRGVSLTVTGMGEDEVPLDEGHLVLQAMRSAFAEMECEVPGLRLHCENRIPHGRGLGSSSAAIVGGICLARGLVAGGSLLMDDDAVFRLAARLEGHPDNVAPAFYGGFTVAWCEAGAFRAAGVSVDPRVRTLVFVPPRPVATSHARGLLPEVVPHAAAVTTAGRAALLVLALGGRPELLLQATEDQLHQDYREPAMPESLELLRKLRGEGIPAVLSGAGPSVLAFVDGTTSSDVHDRCPDGWQLLDLAVDGTGATVRGGR